LSVFCITSENTANIRNFHKTDAEISLLNLQGVIKSEILSWFFDPSQTWIWFRNRAAYRKFFKSKTFSRSVDDWPTY